MAKSSIYSKRVWLNNQLQPATISIEDSKIKKVSIGEKAKNAIDYGNLLIMPGVIDAHTHINEPGRTHWEGFETATKAAAKGGITMLVDMPLNSSPVTINKKALEEKIQAANNKLHVNCGFWAGAINNDLDALTELIDAGCLGVKVFLCHSGLDEFPNISLADLEEVMQGLAAKNVPVLAHCELTSDLPKSEESDPKVYNNYLKSRPEVWETDAIKSFLEIAKRTQCKAHVVHLSAASGIELIEHFKNEGVNFTVETCPHYIFFNAEEIENGRTEFKCAPPIRSLANNRLLIEAIKSGKINFLATDHSPAPPEMKETESGNFMKAWGGIAGLQFFLPASWTALSEDLAVESFIPLLTEKPAKFLGLDHRMGKIEGGYDANICIWNPDDSFIVTKDSIEHRHKITPYLHRKLKGKIHTTIVNGEIAYTEGQFPNKKAGRILLRNNPA